MALLAGYALFTLVSLPTLWMAQFLPEKALFPLVTSLVLGIVGYLVCLPLIPGLSRCFLKAGLHGIDLNKKGKLVM